MRNTKLLFFINHEQTEILKFHLFAKQSVGSDNDINFAFLQTLKNFFFLFGRFKTIYIINSNREILQPVLQRLVMLKSKNSCWNEYSSLLTIQAGLKCCADRYF